MRPIDADELKRGLCAECTLYPDKCLGEDCDWDAIYHIDHAPTIEAEPIKHGRWTGINRNKYNDDEATCSICGVTFASGYSNPSWWDYCPNCGAKMDEVK